MGWGVGAQGRPWPRSYGTDTTCEGPCYCHHLSRSLLLPPLEKVPATATTCQGPCYCHHLSRSLGPCYCHHLSRSLLQPPLVKVPATATTCQGPCCCYHLSRSLLCYCHHTHQDDNCHGCYCYCHGCYCYCREHHLNDVGKPLLPPLLFLLLQPLQHDRGGATS